MFVARSTKYKLQIEGSEFTLRRLDRDEVVKVPSAKFVDVTTGNVIIVNTKPESGVEVEYSYQTLREAERRGVELPDPRKLLACE